MARERTVKVLVIGGGVAGSTAASLLARAGIESVMLAGPRGVGPVIGESILPHTLPILDELGVRDAVEASPLTRRQNGVSFLDRNGAASAVYWFDQTLQPALSPGLHVALDQLDALLLDAAGASGVEVLAGWKAVAPLWEDRRLAGATATAPDGSEATFRSLAVLDASGQSSFLATRMGWRFPYPRHKRNAVVATFANAWLPEGRERGNRIVAATDGGWISLAPFADDTVMVSVVIDINRWRAAGGSAEELFETTVATTPEVKRRLVKASRQGPYTTLPSTSYRTVNLAGDGYCMIGDAAGFLDPVFSTGSLLGMTTAACAAADVTDALMHRGKVSADDFAPTVELIRALQRLYFRFIRAYNDPQFLAYLLAPPTFLKLRAAFGSLLAGDVVRPGQWRRTAGPRLLLWLARLQSLGQRWATPMIDPLAADSGDGKS